MSPSIVLRRTEAPRYAGRPPATKTPSRGRTSSPAVIGREMRAALSQMLKDVLLTAADSVEAVCPVDTGHLLSNFVFSTGKPFTGIAGSRDSVSHAEQDAGREKILAYDVGRDGKIYYTNNVEYLKYQTPFVTEALMTGVAAAPHGHKTRARKALKAMARASFKAGA